MRTKSILICFIKIIFLKNGCSYSIVTYFLSLYIIIFVIVSKSLTKQSTMHESADDTCIFFWRIRFIIISVLYMAYSCSKIDPETA